MRGSLLPPSLRYLDQVARSGSIQRAAKELNVAASAVNRQILLLEEELAVPLFERLPRGMRPTSAGGVIVALVRRWREDERAAVDELKRQRGVNQGHVRIVAMDSHVNGVMPDFVQAMAAAHPAISLAIDITSPDEAITALLNDRADVAAAFNVSPNRGIHVVWTTGLPFGCVVAPGHPLAGQRTISLQEVAAHPIALQSQALPIRRYLDTRYGWLFTNTLRTTVTNSLQLAKALARSGRYVAITSELDAAPELIDGSLIFLPVRDEGAEPQTISVAIDGRKPLSRVGRIAADALAASLNDCLDRVRKTARREAD